MQSSRVEDAVLRMGTHLDAYTFLMIRQFYFSIYLPQI